MSIKPPHVAWLLIGLLFSHLGHTETPEFYEIEIIAFKQPNLSAAFDEYWPAAEASRPLPRLKRLFSAEPPLLDLTTLKGLPESGENRKKDALETDETATIVAAETANPHQDTGLKTALKPLIEKPTADNDSTPVESHQTPAEFTLLTKQQLQLTAVTKSLLKKRLTKNILLHTGWIQQIRPANSAVPILLEGGNPLTPNQPGQQWLKGNYRGYYLGSVSLGTDNFSFPEFELEGTVSFYQTRYPRLETSLCQTLAPKFLTHQLFQPKEPTLIKGDHPSQQICSKEVRGLSYGELIYFDTPSFGIVIQVRVHELLLEPKTALPG